MSAAATTTPPRERPTWARDLEPYSNPTWSRSLLDIATSVVPYLALLVTTYLVFDNSVWLALALTIPRPASCCDLHRLPRLYARLLPAHAEGQQLVRLFMACWSSSPSRTGARHSAHHGSAGDLDRRGTGDVPDADPRRVLLDSPPRIASATACSATPW